MPPAAASRVLSCDFTELDPLATATVSLSVRGTSTGNFVSALKLTASNDNNAANDNRDVAVEIAGGDPAAVSGGGGGGGGGRMEWLALCAGAMVARPDPAALPGPAPLLANAGRPESTGRPDTLIDQNFTFTRAYQKPPLEPNGPPPLG